MVKFKPNNGKKKIKDKKQNPTKIKRLKKKFISHKKKRLKNPSITHFNLYSFFIYDNDEYLQFFNTITNKNLVKVNKEELNFLQSKYNEITFFRGSMKNIQYIRIPNENYQKLKNFISIKKITDPIEEFIKEKINGSMDRRYLSCRRLAQAYKEETVNENGFITVPRGDGNTVKEDFDKEPLTGILTYVIQRAGKDTSKACRYIVLDNKNMVQGYQNVYSKL